MERAAGVAGDSRGILGGSPAKTVHIIIGVNWSTSFEADSDDMYFAYADYSDGDGD